MKTRIIISCMALLALVCSCGKKDAKGGTILTPASTGAPYEVLIVADKEHMADKAGKAIYDALDVDVPGLPQSESAFKISRVAADGFYRQLRFCRNIVMVKIDKTMYTQPKIKFSRDVYSQPQMIMSIQAPDEESFAKFVTESSSQIVDFFTRAEMNREIDLLKKKHNLVVQEKVKEMFGCDVWIPQELNKTKKGKDFYWAATNKGERDMNFVIYSFPYRDLNTFTEEYFFNKRDSVMKANIPGPKENQYMSTARPYVTVSDVEVKGGYAQLARGLWEMENYDMGGPFVSLSRVDEINQKVVVVEAFIYAPGDKKRNLMRRMEAALYTLALPQDTQDNKFKFSLEEVTIQPE